MWNFIHETFGCFKDVAMAVLSLFSSLRSYESLFSVMVGFTLSYATKALRESRVIALLYF